MKLEQWISRENIFYKWRLSEKMTLLEKGSFRERFNWKWKKATNRSSTSESSLAPKAAIKNVKNVHEIIFYLKSQYSTHNEE